MASSPVQQLGVVHINTGAASTPIPVLTGRAIYILGRNGTGKSALVHNLVAQLPKTVYIPGSRPSYFDNDSLQMTPATRRQMEDNWLSWDRQPYSRYRPINGTQRNERAILGLQSGETQFKVDAANEIREQGVAAAAIQRLQSSQSPYDRVNSILRQANLPVTIVMTSAEMQARRDGAPYSIARMSDGERTALILASEIVAAPPHTIFVIDEPELHLHRSIVVPLIAALLRERPDCAFLISTHELELPTAGTDGLVAMVRGCTWIGDTVSSWDVDVISTINEIPEDLRVDLLGSRRKLLFVEGRDTSLDQPFYALLYPGASVRSKDTAREVRQAVKALRSLEGIHHARSFGLVDNDTLDADHVTRLEAEGVYALPIATIESLYYSDEAIASVAAAQGANLGVDANGLIVAARLAGTNSLINAGVQDHLASHVAELKMRNKLLSLIPDRDAMRLAQDPLMIELESPFANELYHLQHLLAQGDVATIIARYPVRESPMLSAIAAALHFRNRGDYERAVLARLGTDQAFRQNIKTKLGALTAALA